MLIGKKELLIGIISLCHTFISHSVFIINICCVTAVHFLSKSKEEYIGCRLDFLKKAVLKTFIISVFKPEMDGYDVIMLTL